MRYIKTFLAQKNDWLPSDIFLHLSSGQFDDNEPALVYHFAYMENQSTEFVRFLCGVDK